MKRINSNLYPKDGHYFRDSDGTTLRAETWPGVIVRVVKYRARAGLPPGEPAREVIEQACSRNPVLCNESSEHTLEQSVKRASLKSRVLGWMGMAKDHKAKGLIEYVDAETAARRAQICATCPLNTALQESCASCQQALAELRKDVLGRRVTDARLNGCLILGEDMRTAAHLERPTTENGELPTHCWRKRVL